MYASVLKRGALPKWSFTSGLAAGAELMLYMSAGSAPAVPGSPYHPKAKDWHAHQSGMSQSTTCLATGHSAFAGAALT